ncbi:MAG: alpha/beta hydrolase [Betaproteobacteria bacterium]|jgi:arylformamidase|nr:alpha/beta hydrolase [Betaproteobacteria bacterium]
MNRRNFLTAAGATIAAGPVLAQAPKVFLDYDQAALDAAYDQSRYAPNLQQVIKRYATNSELTRSRLGAPRRVAYGSQPIEQLEIYRTERANAPVQVFVHGGAWRSGVAKDYAFPAEMFVAAGAHYVVPDFAWVQDAGGSLAPISDQIRRALAWVARNAASFGGDASRIYVSGHSSGGHQAAVLATTDWKRDFGLPPEVVKGYVLVSGIYELYPVSLSARASYVKFDERTLAELSAMRHLERIGAPVTVVYGTLETPEFQRQSREFAQALRKAGMPVQLIVADGYNHFEVMETLANPFQFAGRAALEQMKLKAPL